MIGAAAAALRLPVPEGTGVGVSLSNWIIIAIGFNTYFVARALLGPSTLAAFLTGRYHRPRGEQRVVLFLDLRGSTGLAERLGDLTFHRLLNSMIDDLTDPVAEAGGEVYRYVGDEVIITWPVRHGDEGAAAIGCLFAIEDALSRSRSRYQAEFGIAPRLRAALHAGPVVVGEIGQMKREIVILGDTMNAAARIEQLCRETGRDYIASGAALPAAEILPARLRVEALGPMRLRGKEEAIELFGLSRAGQAPTPAEAPPHTIAAARRWTLSRPEFKLVINLKTAMARGDRVNGRFSLNKTGFTGIEQGRLWGMKGGSRGQA